MPEPRPRTRYIFVTGGVVSSLGKGIAAASIGRLLVSRGLKVAIQKFDPYINVDPGTMSPFQHGEVFVTEDGAETDPRPGSLRALHGRQRLAGRRTSPAGAIYNSVIRKERRGDYLGGTVQVVPHITDEIKHRIRLIGETQDVDVVITEIGGTVGDIESLPFLEAIRQFPVDVGRRNTMFIHLTLVPYIGHAGELKTKPTQHSVNELRAHRHRAGHADLPLRGRAAAGPAQEDRAVRVAAARGDRLRAGRRQHLQDPALLPQRGRGRASSSSTSGSRRAAPEPHRVGAAGQPGERGSGPPAGEDRAGRQVRPARGRLPVGRRGVAPRGLPARARHRHRLGGLRDAGRRRGAAAARERRRHPHPRRLRRARHRGQDHARRGSPASRRSRSWASASACRWRSSSSRATSSAWTARTPASSIPRRRTRSIDLLPEQKDVSDMGGTMRLGADPVKLHEGTRAARSTARPSSTSATATATRSTTSPRKRIEAAGLVVLGARRRTSAWSRSSRSRDHPFFVASQYHPEFKSRPERPAPLFRDFVAAALGRAEELRPHELASEEPAAAR